MKLISMTDFVLKQNKTLDFNPANKWKDCLNYANFINKPLKLEYFVPCDDEGNVLEKETEHSAYADDLKYQQAKEKVLFEGFWLDETYKMKNRQLPYLTNGEISVFLHSDFAIRNQFIEEIAGANITLTQNAIKQFNL